MRDNYQEAVPAFIKKYAKQYVELIDEQTIDYQELIDFLSMDVDEHLKLKLLSLTKEPVSIVDRGYSSTVNEYILSNNLDELDVPELFSRYVQPWICYPTLHRTDQARKRCLSP